MERSVLTRPVGRLAPTPSGHLHLGNALAFGAAWVSARAAGGRVLLRIEDVDTGRARPEFEQSQVEDLRWLGLDWDEQTPPQRDRDYRPWLEALAHRTYHCTCSRTKIRAAAGVYPGTCRAATHSSGAVRLHLPEGSVGFVDRRHGPHDVDPNRFGDPVLRRRDAVFTYPLAVVVDDLVDGVTEVVRGADLLAYTAVQVVLWEALDATPPTWLHSPVLLGPDGRKLSKSHGSTELRALRAAGWSPADVWGTVLPWLGLDGVRDLGDAVARFDPTAGPRGPITVETVTSL